MDFVNLAEQSKNDYEKFLVAARGSFLQTWAWGDFQSSLGNTVHRVGLSKDGQYKIVAQFIEQTIPHLGGKYLYAPFGPVGDLSLTPEFIKQVALHFPNHWFIRIEPQTNYPSIGQTTLHIQPGKTLLTDLTKNEDDLLAKMHHKTRYNIKVAQKHNVEVGVVQNTDEMNKALKLITETSKRQKFTDHPLSYYQSLIKLANSQDPSLGMKVYTAKLQDQLLNCAVMIDSYDTRTYLFGGSNDQNRNVMAPYLLHWQAILDAKNSGKKFYDWWGIETATGKTPGFAKFKLGWGGQQISYPKPEDYVNKTAHYQLYKVLRFLNRLF